MLAHRFDSSIQISNSKFKKEIFNRSDQNQINVILLLLDQNNSNRDRVYKHLVEAEHFV